MHYCTAFFKSSPAFFLIVMFGFTSCSALVELVLVTFVHGISIRRNCGKGQRYTHVYGKMLVHRQSVP